MNKKFMQRLNYENCGCWLGLCWALDAVLLAQHNEVIGIDISLERVEMLNARKSPIIDPELLSFGRKRIEPNRKHQANEVC